MNHPIMSLFYFSSANLASSRFSSSSVQGLPECRSRIETQFTEYFRFFNTQSTSGVMSDTKGKT